MTPLKQILCLYLPHWPITRRYRRRPAPKPVLVIETVAGQRRQIVDASLGAREKEVTPGMSLAEARMLCPGAICVEHDPIGDRRKLESLGRWLTRFTPVVSVAEPPTEGETPAALFLDMTGCQRFFGGIQSIVTLVTGAMRRLGITARIAVAPTPGAAWAFAVAAKESGQIIDADELQSALQSLPLESLRLGDDTLSALHHLGLRSVGQLMALPRKQLPARFGTELLTRLDQLLGFRAEPLVGLVVDTPIQAKLEFEAPIESLESIWCILEQLLMQALAEMTRRGLGARRVELCFTPDRFFGRQPTTKVINLSRPSRNYAILLELLRRATDQLDCGDGFVTFQLSVPLHERVTDEQVSLFNHQTHAGQIELDRLFERLCVRLGDGAIIRPELVGSYLPERAWRPTGTSAVAAPPVHTIAPARPLQLLPMPVEIFVICEPSDERTGKPRQFRWREKVYRLTEAVGPERIACEWWRGHRHTRDYYDVEEETGLRFWVFRVMYELSEVKTTIRWFLHGCF